MLLIKKVIFLLVILSVMQLSSKGLNPISPEIHDLIGLKADNPLLLYYFNEIGIQYEEFADNNDRAKKDFGGIICEYWMPLHDSLESIDISIEEPLQAEEKLSELLKFYRLPVNYSDFDIDAYTRSETDEYQALKDELEEIYGEDTDWENFDWEAFGMSVASDDESEYLSVWQVDSLEIEVINNDENAEYYLKTETVRFIYYVLPGEYNRNIEATYTINGDQYLISRILITGDFYEPVESTWDKAADKYFGRLSAAEKTRIHDLIAQSQSKNEEEEAVYAEIRAQVEKEKAEEEEKLRIEKQEMITVWDEYLETADDLSKMMYMLNLSDLTWQDVADLQKKYEYSDNYTGFYSSYYHQVGINFFEYEVGKYRVNGLKFEIRENQEIPFLGINQAISWNDLLAKFGHNYFLKSLAPSYEVLASTHDAEARELDLAIEFKFIYEEISEIIVRKTSTDNFNYQGVLYFIQSGAVTRDCINGRGIYQFANGVWVDGYFKDGKLTGGVGKELNFVQRDLASIELLWDGDLLYKSKDKSVWKEYFQGDESSNLLQIFNKKDYTADDWTALKENYFYSEDHNYFLSSEDFLQIEASWDKTYIKSLRIKINTAADLMTLGLDNQMSYNELTRRFGTEYIEDKQRYEAILIPKGDYNKKNHLNGYFEMNEDYTEIRYIKLAPRHAEEIMVNGQIAFLPAGANARDGVDYQWIDGYWFSGRLKGGIPWEGSVYYYFSDTPFDYISEGQITKGESPTILTDPSAHSNTVKNLLDEVTGCLNAFDDSQVLMLMYIDNMIEDDERAKYETNWEMLDYYVNKGNDSLDEAFNAIYSLICKLDEKEGTGAAKQQARAILTNISNLEKVVKAYRNIGLRFGNGAEEDIQEMNNYSSYIADIEQAHAELLTELTKCGYY